MGTLQELAPDVAMLPGRIVNVFLVGRPGEPWTLIDTGMPGGAAGLKAAAEARFGKGTRPEAIVLTHAHFDHVGSARALADFWQVPILLHPLEMPYVTGKDSYPPFDPTVGGFFPNLSRLFPESAPDLGPRLRALPEEGRIESLPDWRWVATPGHSPGHVSLFREADGLLIAGDAFITMDMTTVRGWLSRERRLCPPPPYATYDWDEARRSVQALAALRPRLAATGHGDPLSGPDLADQMAQFADGMAPPPHGRYVPSPAVVGADGVESLPPPAPDPVPLIAAGAGVAVAALALAHHRSRRA